MTRERQVSASSKTANMGLTALEQVKQCLAALSVRERLAGCCSLVPLGGGWRSGLGRRSFYFLTSMLLNDRRFQAVSRYALAPPNENLKAMVAFIRSEQVVCSSSQVGGYGNDQRWKSQ